MTVDRVDYVVDHLPNGDAVVQRVTYETVKNFGHGDGDGISGWVATDAALGERDRLKRQSSGRPGGSDAS